MKTTLGFSLPAIMLLAAGCAIDDTSEEQTGQFEGLRSASSVVSDVAGDSTSSAPYLDVIHAKITQQGDGALFFLMVLAGPIPTAPSEADLIWPFHIDTDPSSSPGNLYVDYVVRVRWFNGAFVGQVLDRTQIGSGGALVVTSVPFSLDGATVKAYVDPALLGNPSTFDWNASTRPGQNEPYADFAPNCFTCLVTWTSK